MTTAEEQSNNHNMLILKELGDIKTALAVNTNETTNIKNSVNDVRAETMEIKKKVEFQNGRVRTLEDWSINAQKIIENTGTTVGDYKSDRVKVWTAIAVLIFLGGAIITLSIMAIDSKIQSGIQNALSQYDIQTKQ